MKITAKALFATAISLVSAVAAVPVGPVELGKHVWIDRTGTYYKSEAKAAAQYPRFANGRHYIWSDRDGDKNYHVDPDGVFHNLVKVDGPTEGDTHREWKGILIP